MESSEETRARQQLFIKYYIEKKGVKSFAAKEANIPYSTVKHWFANDKAFVAQVNEAWDTFIDLLKANSIIKASNGKSDVLAMFFMKAYEPEVFDDDIRREKFKQQQVAERPKSITLNIHSGPIPERVRKEREAKAKALEQEKNQEDQKLLDDPDAVDIGGDDE